LDFAGGLSVRGAASMDGNLLLQFPHTPHPMANAGIKLTGRYSRRTLAESVAAKAGSATRLSYKNFWED